MGKIDTSGWKEFRVGDLFAAERGKVKNIQPLCPGETPIIAAGAYNQGIAGMYEIDSAYENRITISCNGAGCGSTFYHPYKFNVNGDAITLIEKNSMSDKAKSFIACILNGAFTRKYSYEEKCSPQKALDEIVRLPATPDGDPDWAYMESYMANLEAKVAESLTMLQAAKDAEKKKVDTREWGEFRVGELFDIHPTKAYKCTNAELLDNGETHVVVNSAYNNGVGGLSTLKPTEQGNMITFSDTVDANTIFYQDKPFIGYPHVQGLYPIGIFRKNWTELSLKYFATVFRQKALSIGFDYGNKFRRDIAVKLYIFLPVDKTGQPDWVYMEEHMRKVEERVKATIGELKVSLPTK
jgi:hypothetical protein